MEFLLFLVIAGFLLLTLAWPGFAVGAVVLVVRGLLVLRREQMTRDRPRALRRVGWSLAGGAALAAMAAYGYGLQQTTIMMWTEPDDRCRLVHPDLLPPDGGYTSAGSSSSWPLHDTTCGPDLVPGFVNPLVTGSAIVFAALTATMIWMKISHRRSSLC